MRIGDLRRQSVTHPLRQRDFEGVIVRVRIPETGRDTAPVRVEHGSRRIRDGPQIPFRALLQGQHDRGVVRY